MLKTFITEDCGGTLYQELLINYNEKLLVDAVKEYIDIQQSIKCDDVKAFGLRDLSTINLFAELEKKISFFDKEKQEKLISLKDKINKDLNNLLELGLQDTIEHGDFHLNNILFDKANNRLVFIDWVRSNIANPFFSLFSLFYSLERRLNIKESDLTRKIARIYCSSFKDYWNIKETNINQIYEISERLYPLYFIVTRFDLVEFKETEELNIKISKSTTELLSNYSN